MIIFTEQLSTFSKLYFYYYIIISEDKRKGKIERKSIKKMFFQYIFINTKVSLTTHTLLENFNLNFFIDTHK